MFELSCISQKLSDSGNILKVPRIRTLDRLLNLAGTYSNHWALKGSSRPDALLWERRNLLHLIGYVGGGLMLCYGRRGTFCT
jgi:hypothetical protein